MKIISKLDIKDFFAWGVWQKINLTGNREISFEEIEKFANEVKNSVEEKEDFECIVNLNEELNAKILKRFDRYLSHNNKGVRLNDNMSFEDSKKAFLMEAVPRAYISILSDKKIGEKVFLNKAKNAEQSL